MAIYVLGVHSLWIYCLVNSSTCCVSSQHPIKFGFLIKSCLQVILALLIVCLRKCRCLFTVIACPTHEALPIKWMAHILLINFIVNKYEFHSFKWDIFELWYSRVRENLFYIELYSIHLYCHKQCMFTITFQLSFCYCKHVLTLLICMSCFAYMSIIVCFFT